MSSKFDQWVADIHYFQQLVGMKETDEVTLRRDWRRLTIKARNREATRAAARLALLFAEDTHLDNGRNIDKDATSTIQMSLREDFEAFDECPLLVRIAVAYAPVGLSSALSLNICKQWGERYAARWIMYEMSQRYPGYMRSVNYDLPAGVKVN